MHFEENTNMITVNHTKGQFDFNGQLNMNVSIAFYVIQWFLLFPTVYVNTLVYRMAKKEDLLISLELKVVSVVYITASLCSIVYQAVIIFAFPASHLIGDWFCQTSNVLMSAVMVQQLILTFTISLHRYVFIIYSDTSTKTEKIKKRVTWTIFVVKSIVILLITAKFVIFNEKYAFVKFWTSVCNGDVLLLNTNQTEIEYIQHHIAFTLLSDDGSLITIFGHIKDHILAIFLQVVCVIIDLIVYLTCCNVAEGVMYCRIAKFWER